MSVSESSAEFLSTSGQISGRGVSQWRIALALAVIALFALALRSLGFGDVFVGPGEVVLNFADASYHARRALYGFANFPSVLAFDPYLAFPDGAPVPMPPLFDWLLAGVARAFGDFERVAAWSSPVLGALVVVPVYGLARDLAGSAAGLAAALLYAAIPMATVFCEIGNPDHHAAVALLIALYAWSSLRLLAARSGRSRLWGPALGLFAIRVAIVLTWSGSLLILAIAEGALLVGACADGRRSVFQIQAAGALAAALADNFGVWLDPGKFAATRSFYAARSEADAMSLAEELGARYVMTADHPGLRPPRLDYRLHREHGSARTDAPHLEHFRLVAEGPRDGRPLAALSPPGTSPAGVPYKLFERVEGASLQWPARPGSLASVAVVLLSPLGERFRFVARAGVSADGIARVRVPYATDSVTRTRAVGPYRAVSGERVYEFDVSEEDVRRGYMAPRRR